MSQPKGHETIANTEDDGFVEAAPVRYTVR